MKKLLLFSLCFLLQPAMAQSEKKPSWSEELPEKVEAPDMEVLKETRKKIELELDMSDFSRPDLEDPDFSSDERANAEVQTAEKAQQEAARLAEEQRRQEEAARLAEEQRRQEEAARLAEEQRRQEEAARLAEEQHRQEEAARLAEEQRRQEEAARLAEEQRRQEEAARLAEEQRRQEEATRLAEEQRRQEEATRLAEEKRRQQEEAELAAHRQALQAEEEAKRQAAAPEADNQSGAADGKGEAQGAYVWKFTHRVAPDYPIKAFRERKQGWVDVDVTIAPNGTVIDAAVVRIYRNQRIFAKPALKAVRQWLFDPPENYGINQPQTRRYRVEFKLDEEARNWAPHDSALQSGV